MKRMNSIEQKQPLDIRKVIRMEPKTKKPIIPKKKQPVVSTETGYPFVPQIYRKDMLQNMLNLSSISHLSPYQKFRIIITDNIPTGKNDERRQGWIYETLCIILILCKCFPTLQYDKICSGQIQNIKHIAHCKEVLDLSVEGCGNNIADIILIIKGIAILFSVKYKKKYGETDISKMNDTVTQQNIFNGNHKYALIVKDKNTTINHKFKNDFNIDKIHLDTIQRNNLLFDETDVVKALDSFFHAFENLPVRPIYETMEYINTYYLGSKRIPLFQKTHQALALAKFKELVQTRKHKQFCFAHKPRSGKSIIVLLVCKHLLNTGYDKILIMTPVPATIDSFVQTLDEFTDFKDIQYRQLPKDELENDFKGIVFCSVQYLKADKKGQKKTLLKKAGFKVIVTDEAHQGGSTHKTKTRILNVNDSDTEEVQGAVDEIRKTVQLHLFVSGTADRTRKYYGIHPSCVFEWETCDEAYMKRLANPDNPERAENIRYMVNRHGPHFNTCYDSAGLNHDYSKCPTQVLIKHTIPDTIIKEIVAYNTKYGTNYGFHCGSLFALKQVVNEKGEKVYLEEFELCGSIDGEDILKGFLELICSKNRMNKNTVMKKIEETQTANHSRKTSREEPLLFILYLPTHNGNGPIHLLQKTLKQFLRTHGLWSDYNIEYANSLEDSGNVKEGYNSLIQTFMEKTKRDGRMGCVLLLGNKGAVGITYPKCDVTISLDDGHCLDNQKQRFSRALTEAKGKTVGINVDMNIQRTYLYLMDVIHRFRKVSKTTQTNADILHYLFQQNIFLFNPQEIHHGHFKKAEIITYYQTETDKMMQEIDDTPFLEEIVCDDDMRDFIQTHFQKQNLLSKKASLELEGEQLDCPKGDKTAVVIDGPTETESSRVSLNEEETVVKIQELINQTLEMCKTVLFPLLALLSRSFKIFDFKEIFTHEITGSLIMALLRDKKIDLNENNKSNVIDIMNNIIDNNAEIVNNIREIYSVAPAHKLRQLIEKHFIPTQDEKKQNAEVPTPVVLVNEMLNFIPTDFWTKPHKVFEPCCGKGNFVLGIFDRFYQGLEAEYPDEIVRCQVILTQCIYYADLTALNVFITTELLKCHVQSYCGLDELDYEFNCYTGDTLKLDIHRVWNITGFDAVIGNPPYQPPSNDKKGGTSIWNEFVSLSLSKLLKERGYLVFVHPALWRKPDNKLREEMFSKQIHHLSIHNKIEGNKLFGATTRFDYYLLENTKPYKKTHVVFEDKQEYDIFITTEMPFIPNFGWSIFEKVFQKLNNNGIMTNRDSDCHTSRKYVTKIKTDEYKYELLNSISKTKGKTFCYSSKPHKVQNKKKVLFSNGETIVPFYDDGVLGVTEGGLYTIVNDETEGKKLVEFLNSKLVVYLIKATKWSNFETCKQLFWFIPTPATNLTVNDDNVNTYFDLTSEEIIAVSK